MSRAYINLARDPYVNSRPVVRLAILLWVLGALLLAGNVWLYWDFLAGRGDTHARLRQVETEIAEARERLVELDRSLADLDLADQNRQVAYLNERIERRHFAWSRLFDKLAGLLPDDVRLTSLSPATGEAGSGRSRSRGGIEIESDEVLLSIDAEARDDESILRLVDALFADPAFRRPSLQSQRRQDNGLIRFDLETVYRPERPVTTVPADVGPAGGAPPPEAVPLSAAASSPPELR